MNELYVHFFFSAGPIYHTEGDSKWGEGDGFRAKEVVALLSLCGSVDRR